MSSSSSSILFFDFFLLGTCAAKDSARGTDELPEMQEEGTRGCGRNGW
jgi:hypothetical protein